MKKSNILYGAVAASMMFFASCSNDYPTFDDADAFVAFTNTSMSVDEFGESLEVPVLLTSLAGLNGSVTIEVDAENSTAVEGVHYTFAGEKTLNFTGEAPTQYLKLNIIDNGEFGGDKKLVLNLVDANGANLGASTTCSITIADDEHPLQDVLGTYKAVGKSYWYGETEWTVYLTKDDTDVSKVWIYPFVPNGTNKYIYGIVNEDHTELKIPISQTVAVTSYGDCTLEGFYGPDGKEDILTGGYVTLTIDNGVMTTTDWFGTYIPSEDSWYNIMVGATLTKQ